MLRTTLQDQTTWTFLNTLNFKRHTFGTLLFSYFGFGVLQTPHRLYLHLLSKSPFSSTCRSNSWYFDKERRRSHRGPGFLCHLCWNPSPAETVFVCSVCLCTDAMETSHTSQIEFLSRFLFSTQFIVVVIKDKDKSISKTKLIPGWTAKCITWK